VKKSRQERADGTVREYRYGKIVQSKPKTVAMLKSMGMKYHIDRYDSDHDKFKTNYEKHVFTVPLEAFEIMEREGVSEGLNWDFLSKLTERQLKLLYDTMMLGCGTGQNRFSGEEHTVFYMTLIQTMLGLPSTFYQQEENCWRTRILTERKKFVTCQYGVQEIDYSGTIWCPSVDTGFWLAEREGLVFVTGNTETNFRTMTGLIPGVDKFINRMIGDVPAPKGMENLYRKFWGRVALRIAVATILAQMFLNGGDEPEKFYEEQLLSDRFNKFRWTEVEITNIYRALGIDTQGQRKTFSLGGHFFDPLKLIDFTDLIKAKGSPFTRVIGAVGSGSDWQGKPFTAANTLFATGKTVKKSPYEEKENVFLALPSMVVNQVVSMQPMQVSHFIKYWQGEEDGLSMLLLAAGSHLHTAWKPKLTAPVIPVKGADNAYDEISRLSDSDSLKMGPPSRHIMFGDESVEMSREQYERYLDASSAIVGRKLEILVGTEGWKKLDDKRKSEIIHAMVMNARRRARASIKREIAIDQYKKRQAKENA
jgi:hypothetical protein